MMKVIEAVIMINTTPPPTALPTMTPRWLVKSLELPPPWVGDEAGLDGDMNEVALFLTLNVLIGVGIDSGSWPTAIATTSLYVSFGRLVTLVNAHRGIAVPGGIL